MDNMQLQCVSLFPKFNTLQYQFGEPKLKSIYGVGCVKDPKLFLIFINPTGRNVSANPKWKGLRAPWLGTKNIWKLFFKSELLSNKFFEQTQSLKPNEWTPLFSLKLYAHLAKQEVYITNFAKCTQTDARPLKNGVFHAYRELLLREIDLISPKKIVTFGNLVSRLLLQKSIKVSEYSSKQFEILKIGDHDYRVYPTFYPVGQGLRNMRKAMQRIKLVSKSH